ncbi:MAG: lytic transglycosylase domain-containing protein [Acidobacteria bacterium]|nr:lytic transglycosylase domain-containing protein [Acidobacteriota bacterium]
MPPSRFARRCLVLLLLVAAGAGFLARPAEAAKRPFADIVDDAARQHGVDPDLVHAVIAVESRYRANAQSPAGAQGLMQLMPGTQHDLGVSDAFDPRQNVDAGVAYLRRLTDEFGTELALAAYNAGPAAVRRYNGIPPYEETHAYVQAVLDQAAEEHVPSRDRTHTISEAGLAEPATVGRQAQDDHLALDGAAGLEPQAVDLDDRPETAASPGQLVNPRGTPPGTLRQVAIDEHPLQVEGAGGADTARRGLHHGADPLMDAGLQHRDPANHVTSTPAGSHQGRFGARSHAAAYPRFKMQSRTSATDASALQGYFEHLATLAAGQSPDPAAGA